MADTTLFPTTLPTEDKESQKVAAEAAAEALSPASAPAEAEAEAIKGDAPVTTGATLITEAAPVAAAAPTLDATTAADVTPAIQDIPTSDETPKKETETSATAEEALIIPQYGESPLLSAMSEEDIRRAAHLQSRLTAILTTAQKETEEPIASEIWGVDLDQTSTDPRLPILLSKFIRANPEDVAAAEKMLTKMLVWRATFRIPHLMTEEFPQEIFSHVGYIHGADKDGHPVVYNRYGYLNGKEVFSDLNRFLRWRVQLMEKSMLRCDLRTSETLLMVHDYAGVGILSYDKAAKAASKATIALMQENYPECLATKLFVNVPWWGASIYKVVSLLIPEATRRKLQVVASGETQAVLRKYVAEDNLPPLYLPKVEAASPEPVSKGDTPPEPVPKDDHAPQEDVRAEALTEDVPKDKDLPTPAELLPSDTVHSTDTAITRDLPVVADPVESEVTTEDVVKTEDKVEAEAKTEDKVEAEAKTEDKVEAEAKTEEEAETEVKTEAEIKA